LGGECVKVINLDPIHSRVILNLSNKYAVVQMTYYVIEWSFENNSMPFPMVATNAG